MIQEKAVRDAMRIFRHCLDHKGVLKEEDDTELFEAARSQETAEMLSILEEEMDVKFLGAAGSLYLIPSFDNTTLGMSLREYREDLGMTTRLETAFLTSYIQMIIFWLFFGGKNSSNPQQRDFIQMKDLIQEVDHLFEQMEQEADTVLAFDSQYKYNFQKIIPLWKSRQYGGEGQETTTKYGTVRRAVNQLRDHNLLTFVENEVRPTRELCDKFLNYYLREERVRQIHELFSAVEGD